MKVYIYEYFDQEFAILAGSNFFFIWLQFLIDRLVSVEAKYVIINPLRACLELSLRNRAFKSKRAFGQKLHF
jgi:hypothetical protein